MEQKQDLSASYQDQSPNISQSEGATTAEQSGTIKYLKNTIDQLKVDVTNMKNKLDEVNKGLTSNTTKLLNTSTDDDTDVKKS